MYPIMLDVRDRHCLVVGGGGVALRKIEGLLAEGARVTAIAAQPIAALEQLAGEGRIDLRRRAYRDGEAGGGDYRLVFAATDDRSVNRRVYQDAEAAGRWANVADDPELCSFHLPARVQRGALQLAIASGGAAPFAARRLRQLLERRFGPEWSAWADCAAGFRRSVRAAGLEPAREADCFERFFAATVDARRLQPRVLGDAEQNALLAAAGADQARPRPCDAARRAGAAAPAAGWVCLVGAGPGDPGLLSVRGRRRLLAADAVVYDRLAVNALPPELADLVELHPVGKRADHHPVPQPEINALLVRLARAGKRVVRLKGGDPFVFGRGGEEAEALVAAGIRFEVVPAVTAGVAVPAYAGIPVTHRNRAVRLTLVTAHESIKTDGPQVRWDLLAGDPHATLVGYMGVSSLPRVAEALMAAGMPADTPAALIQRGTTAAQRSVRAPLSALHEAGQRAGIRPPAVFVIGPTVELAGQLDWFAHRPLVGQRLLLPAASRRLEETLDCAGAEVVCVPLPPGPAAQVVLAALPLTGCVLADPDQVDALDEQRDGPGWGTGLVCWCVNEATAAHARRRGWPRVERVDDPGDGARLVDAIAEGPQAGA